MSLNKVTLTGTYTDGDGNPLAGTLKFTPNTQLTDSADSVVVRQQPITVTLSAEGTFSESLYATDDAALEPSGWCWVVQEYITGLSPSSWQFFLPHAGGATQDISALEPVAGAPATSLYLPLTGGTMTGFPVLPGNPAAALQAAPKQYVDAETTRAEAAEAALSSDLSGYQSLLAPTAVKTANYTAAAGQLVLVSTASGNVTVTLPGAAEPGGSAAVKMVVLGTGNHVTVATSGSDIFNVSGGASTLTLSLLNQGVTLVSNGAGVWVVQNDDLPLGQTDARYVQQSQTFSLANDALQDLLQWTVTGQTDSGLGPFGVAAYSKTYGSPAVQGPAFNFGYNPLVSINNPSNGHGSAIANFYADAGDTNSSGAHGLEINLSFFSPNGSAATGAFQMVAVDDNSNTVHTIVRCGTGTSGAYNSYITFQNADASTTFAQFSQSSTNFVVYVPTTISSTALSLSQNSASTNSVLTVAATGSSSEAVLVLEGGGSVTASSINFNTTSLTAWQINHALPYLQIKDVVNSRAACYFYPGSSAANSNAQFNSKVQSLSSMVVGNAAIATTATDGFLYLPSCPGAPTGTPTTQAGTVACVLDSTDSKLYAYIGGSWKSATLA